jgi:SAM-dependent methyltransferase
LHPCGCENVEAPDGAWRCARKCPHHAGVARRFPRGRAYYEHLGVIDGTELTPSLHVAELTDALGELPPAPSAAATALEVGCGVSPYFRLITGKGYHYRGIDADPWACDFMTRRYGARVLCADFPGAFGGGEEFDLVFCAHALEHLADAPAALRVVHRLLRKGRPLWLVIPDGSDRINPDHLWFFDRPSLAETLRSCGFDRVRVEQRRVVEPEDFLYAEAYKPE